MPLSLLRSRNGVGTPVTNTELFFDLIYVFAVTQISLRLVDDPTWHGAADAALLLALVWQAWATTAWATNRLDPDRAPTRVMLMLVALGSLVMSAGLPEATGDRGLWVGAAYAAMQLVRSVYTSLATRGTAAHANDQRILAWCVLSSALVVVGGTGDGYVRELLWLGAVAVDVAGGSTGFWTPGLGRSDTAEWAIDGRHFAERCQAFVLIALGESVVATGGTLAGGEDRLPGPSVVVAFVVAFVGVAMFWWLFFGSSAERGAAAISSSNDPGAMARAYHLLHPVMIAGIVATAAGNEKLLADPTADAGDGTAWLLAGGTALFVGGFALYRAVTGIKPTSARYLGAYAVWLAVLVLTAIFGARLPALACAAICVAVLVLLATKVRDAPAR